MALLNRDLKKKSADQIPLMKRHDEKILAPDTETDGKVSVDMSNADSDDDDFGEKPFKQHDITLWVSDAVVLVVEHLQYYAVLLALSEHWGWPKGWINATSFTFMANIDIWEIRKVETGLFHHSASSFINTSKVGFKYTTYIALWCVVLSGITAVFGLVYFRWMKRRPLYLLLYVARWKRIVFLVWQFLALPFGIAAARVFHCRTLEGEVVTEVMAVMNDITCFSTSHIVIMVLVLLIFVILFLVYPCVLIKWIREQVFSGDPKRHEGNLQLKEAEYEQGLDILWDIGQYHLFSSFKRTWIHYNPLKFTFKFLVLVAFALSVHSPFWASAAVTALFSLAIVSLLCKRPFRVRSFNAMIICSHFVIALNALIGNFLVRPPWENVDDFQLVSFLRPPSLLHIIIFINITWLVFLACWIAYLVLVNYHVISSERLWPRLSYDSSNVIGEDSKKYLKAALRARHTLERALTTLPLFAPIHELAHQIKVVNAYCREAEYIGDPTHSTLWDLLDELIDAHNQLCNVSVFGMSGKSSVKETSEEFIRLMPSFRKRLKQREYDFILVPPVKRRLLLKMYILSVFLSNRKSKSTPAQDTATKLQEALAMFDTKSLSDYDNESTIRSTTLSASSRMISTRGGGSTMTGFLNDVDNLIGASKPSKLRSQLTVGSKRSLGSGSVIVSPPPGRKASGHQFSSKSNLSDDTGSKQSLGSKRSLGSTPIVISPPPTIRQQQQQPQPNSPSISKTSLSVEQSQRMSDSTSSLHGGRQNDMPRLTSSSTSLKADSSRPGTAPTSTRSNTPKSLPGSTTSLKEQIEQSRPRTTPSPSRANTPSAAFMSREMPSTASIPGQIDETEEVEMRQSTTMLK